MKKLLIKFSTHLVILSILAFPLLLGSQGGTTPPPVPSPVTIVGQIQNPFNCGGATNCDLMALILAILNNIIMPIATVAVTMWIIWAGFQFLTAQGNEKKITDAKQNLLWSLIGAGILLGAVGIGKVVENTVRALIAP